MKIFKNKKIIVTGHTGFKGSWLVCWLKILGAEIMGVSLRPLNSYNHFSILKKRINIKSKYIDITDEKKINRVINDFKPDFVFHLAAQSIVSKSYISPKLTFETNAIGTFNILNALLKLKKKCTAIIITSDKCYENIETKKGYKEDDKLGGKDFYSASKASAEIIFKAFYKSFIEQNNKYLRIASARAGNVIGGGDWTEDRIIPDCVKKWSKNQKVIIKNPNSTRPWQHVLDALYGYLKLAEKLNKDNEINGQSFNFSNNKIKNYSVIKLLEKLKKNWKSADWKIKNSKTNFKESNLLQLSNLKAMKSLSWKSKLDISKTAKLTSEWYKNFYSPKKKILTFSQIKYFESLI